MTGRFPEHAHEEFVAIRPGHFWFETRREILAATVSEVLREAPAGTCVEVGCGDGFVLQGLPGPWIGIDTNVADLVRAHAKSLVCVLASAEALPLRPPIGMVALFDVIEHFDSPRPLLIEARRLLGPNGKLIVTVPAGHNLWTSRDEYAGHSQRYSRSELAQTIGEAGFRVRRIFPLFRCLWPMAWLSARLPPPRAEDSYTVGRLPNWLLRRILSWEWRLLGDLPFGAGTSWCCIAEI